MARLSNHSLLIATAICFGCVVPAATHAQSPGAAPATASAEPRDGQHDFDFMFGTFKIRVRRLRNPLHGSNDWYEMTGTTVCHPLWNGKANIEEAELDGPD